MSRNQQPLPDVMDELRQHVVRMLQCLVCFKQMTPPVVMCLNGHNMCGPCRMKDPRCPVCDILLEELICNKTLDELWQLVQQPSTHEGRGCLENIATRKSMDRSLLPIPDLTCSGNGQLEDIKNLLAGNHPTQIQYSEYKSLVINYNSGRQSLPDIMNQPTQQLCTDQVRALPCSETAIVTANKSLSDLGDYDCPLLPIPGFSCSWKGHYEEMKDHVEEVHPTRIYNMEHKSHVIYCNFDRGPYKTAFLCYLNEHLFVCHEMLMHDPLRYCTLVQYMGKCYKASRFQYSVKFTTSRGKKVCTKKVHSRNVHIVNAMCSNICSVITTDDLMPQKKVACELSITYVNCLTKK